MQDSLPGGVRTSRHELPVDYDAAIPASRAADQRRRIVGGSISTGISVIGVVAVLLFVWLRRDWQFSEVTTMLTWVFASSAVIGSVILIARAIWLSRLRQGVRAVGDGLAMVLSRDGIETEDGLMPWDRIARIAAAKGKPGHGYRLLVECVDGATTEFPLEGLGILPGTLDSAARAYSAGRHGIDLSIVDD
ncbi:MAG: hypothetical protein Q4F67_11380 [Propionibacteriaceae bacterium]|nr:hypothetical protein [Propionibacteriaceae bacterium]